MNLFLTKEMNVKSRPPGKSPSRKSVVALDDKKILSILDSAPDSTLVIDHDGLVVWANARAASLFGRSAHDLSHILLHDLIPEIRTALFPHDVHAFFAEPVDHRAGQKTGLPVKRGDGSSIWIDIAFSPLTLGDRTFTWASVRELASNPAADDNPRKTHTYARSLIEASMDPQISNGPDGIIGDVNEAMVQVTGVNRETLIGTAFAQYFTEPRKAEEAHQQAFYKGNVLNYPLSIRHVSGKITDVLYNARVYKDQNGIVQGVYASFGILPSASRRKKK